MTDTTFDVDNCVNNFARSVGNGAKMTEHFAKAVEYVIEKRDTTVITRIVQRAVARKDTAVARLVLSTFGKIFVGAKATKKAGKLVGIKISNATLNNKAVVALAELNSDGASMRGPKFRKAFAGDKVPAEFNAIAAADRFVKANPTPAALEAMIAALQAKRTVVQIAAE